MAKTNIKTNDVLFQTKTSLPLANPLPLDNVEIKKALLKDKDTKLIEVQKDHISSTKDLTFLTSSCQECLFWTSINDSDDYGSCRNNPPSVHSGIIKNEGSLFIYPLTLKTLPACSKFNSKQ